MNICLFEDSAIENLYPMIYFRPVCHLRVGGFTIKEKIERVLSPEGIFVRSRDYITEYFGFKPVEKQSSYWFLNASLLPYKENLEWLKNNVNRSVFEGDRLVSFFGTPEEFAAVQKENLSSAPPRQPLLFHWIWNLFDHNEALLEEDFQFFSEKPPVEKDFPGVWFVGAKKIKIGKKVTLEPGVVLDASEGPVVLQDGVTVQANAMIKGPVVIGTGSLVKAGAKLYGHLSCGPVCKLNGEIEESIILGYSNKQHDGFLGHAYLGEWINLGAGTTNSDLKNNYGEITVTLNGKSIRTGRRFLGLIMGDHSKSAINTSFNTGTIVGVSANIFMRQFPPKFIPSFSWVGDSGMQQYQMEKAVQVAETVMGRRRKSFGEKEEKLFETVKSLSTKIEETA